MATSPDPSAEIRARLQTAITRLEGIARGSGALDMLDTLASIGLVEHELEIAKAAARHALRGQP